MIHQLFATSCLAGLVVAGAAVPMANAAPNPSGTGPPGQSCQDIRSAGGTSPGHATSSPGSPFNEAGLDSANGGIGGQHYTEKSQYDVACFQVSSAPVNATAPSTSTTDMTTPVAVAPTPVTKGHNPHGG